MLSSAALIASVAVAPAHTKKYPTNVGKVKRAFIQGEGYRYWGRISSSEPACEKRRYVSVVVNVTEGAEDVRSSSSGKWEIISTFGAPTETYVTVSGGTLSAGPGHSHTCKVAQGSTKFDDDIRPEF